MTNVNFDSLHKNNINKNRLDKYQKYLDILSNSLNKIHKVNFNKGYWEIIIGPWLLFFISSFDTIYTNQKYISHNVNNPHPVKKNFVQLPYGTQDFMILNYQKDYFSNLNNLSNLIDDKRLEFSLIVFNCSRPNLVL